MDATSLLNELRARYPAITFVVGDGFRWSPREQTVHTGSLDTERNQITLLHETGHALAGHTEYNKDIELLALEREAWTVARTQIAPHFGITITQEIIEDALDTYRDWLHARSRCPECAQNGVQASPGTYYCLICHAKWRVNDARQCGLKRYRLHTLKTPAM